WTEEYRFRRADGTYAVVQGRAHLVRNEVGAPVRVISALSGLSNAHRADRQLWGGPREPGAPEVAGHRGWWADTGEPVRPDEWGVLRAIGGEFSADEE